MAKHVTEQIQPSPQPKLDLHNCTQHYASALTRVLSRPSLRSPQDALAALQQDVNGYLAARYEEGRAAVEKLDATEAATAARRPSHSGGLWPFGRGSRSAGPNHVGAGIHLRCEVPACVHTGVCHVASVRVCVGEDVK